MKIAFSVFTFLLLLSTANSVAASEKASGTTSPTNTLSVGKHYKPLSAIHKNFQIGLSLDMAGPVLFNDTPDTKIDTLTAFEYGGSLSFILGGEMTDYHRFGLGVSYHMIARSEERNLDAAKPFLIYEIGHPFVLQMRAGYSLAMGTKEFAENYSGVYAGISMKYSFRNPRSTSPISVAGAFSADVTISPEAAEYSTVFVGVKLEISYHK